MNKDIEFSDYYEEKPTVKEDYDNLEKYSFNILLKELEKNNEYKDKILDHLFMRAYTNESINAIKKYLADNNEYTKYAVKVATSDDLDKKIKLVMCYERNLLDVIFKDYKNLINILVNECNNPAYYFNNIDYIVCLTPLIEDKNDICLIKRSVIEASKKYYKSVKDFCEKYVEDNKDILEEWFGEIDYKKQNEENEEFLIKLKLSEIDKIVSLKFKK